MISAAVQTTIAAGVVIVLLRIGKHWSPAIREAIAAIAAVKFLLPATFLGGGLFAWVAASNTGESLMALSWPVAVGVHVAGSVIVLGALLADAVRSRRLVRASAEAIDGRLHERCAIVARRMGLRRMPRIWVSAQAQGPLAWRLGSELREILEDGSDDRVVASGLASRDRYCDVLVACARTSAASRPTSLGFGDRRHPVARRILRLGADRAPRTSWRAKAAALSLAAMLLPGIPEPPHLEVQVVVLKRITRVNH